MSSVDLDVVPTSAPSEVTRQAVKSQSVETDDTLEEASDWRLNSYWPSLEMRGLLESGSRLFKAKNEPEWKTDPLWILDHEAKCWNQTHPLAQMQWTREKNRTTDGRYIQVVKALKWWRRIMVPVPERPKGYPFEHILGACCPDGITSVAAGVTQTLEELVSRFAIYAALKQTPQLMDHGVQQNVLHRITGKDFAAFHAVATEATKLARRAYEEPNAVESAKLWRELFGSKFETPDESNGSKGGGFTGGFSERREETDLPPGRFA